MREYHKMPPEKPGWLSGVFIVLLWFSILMLLHHYI